MGMQIEKSFTVAAPVPAVWAFLTDPYRVARCLPGAAITGQTDDGAYNGTITIKVGPVTASYRGKLRFDRLDEAAGEAELSGSGQETKGKGGADMRMKSRVTAGPDGTTQVVVTSDVNVMGVLAQFGRGMIQDVSDQLFQKFTEALRRELETPAAATAPPGERENPTDLSDRSDPTDRTDARPAPHETGGGGSGAPSPEARNGGTPLPERSEPPAPIDFERLPPRAPRSPPGETHPPAEPALEALDVGALGAAAARRALGRTLRRPAFWIIVLVLVFILWWLFLR